MAPAATIGVLNCRVRLPVGASGADAGRVDRTLRRELPLMLSDHLGDTGAADPRIVVARSLATRVRLPRLETNGMGFCDRWARGITRDILRLVEHARSDEVRIFSDRADWVGACLLDLLNEDAADRPWWHGPLAAVTRGKPRAEAVAALLKSERSSFLAVLVGLDRGGNLQPLLDALPSAACAVLLDEVVGSRDARTRDRLRPILTAALGLLGLRCSPAECEALLTRWAAHAETPNWRSPCALADAIVVACGFIRDEQPDGQAALDAALARGRAASSELTWLDRDHLHKGLAALRAGAGPLDLLPAAIACAFAATLSDPSEEPDRLALRALARLAAEQPRLAELAAAGTTICWAAPLALQLARLPEQERKAAADAYGENRGALRDRSDEQNIDAVAHPPVAKVLRALARTRLAGAGSLTEAVSGSTSACAGVAVMLRAIADANLSGRLVAARGDAPSLPEAPVLAAALLCCWAGPSAVDADGRLDPAIGVLLGDQVPETADDLAAALAAIRKSDLATLAEALGYASMSPEEGADLTALAGPPRLALDPLIARIAARLLMRWAAWLQGFEHSSSGWLLERAVRRTGSMVVTGDMLEVRLSPLPLDVVLRGAGYLDPFATPRWMPWRRIAFRVDAQGR